MDIIIQSKMLLNAITVVFRILGALYSPIIDCDETFNFWEPAHFMFYGYGMQTWEMAPAYALRSYSYLAPHGLVGYALSQAFAFCSSQNVCDKEIEPKIVGFYGLRLVLAFVSSVCEIKLARAVESRFGRDVGRVAQFFMATSPGMFIAAPAFLPTSTSMVVVMYALALWIKKSHILACTIASFGGIWCGWPFVGAIFVPLGLDTIFARGLVPTTLAVAGGAFFAVSISLVFDYIYFGRFVVPAAKIVVYNVFGAGGDDGSAVGAELYGTESWTFFLKNGVLNFNVMFPMALILPISMLGMWTISVSEKASRRKGTAWRCLLTSSPMFIWLAVMQSRAHKEERFLYVIYPIICVAAAATLIFFVKPIVETSVRCVGVAKHRARARLTSLFVGIVMFASLALSSSRIASQVIGYGAPLTIYEKLAAHLHRIPTTDNNIDNRVSVCVGGEWYRFASSYFLPTNTRLEFLKSSFSGQLPQPFLEPNESSRGGFYAQTSSPRDHFNNVNREEPSRYVHISHCDYVVDLDLGYSRDDWNEGGIESPWLAKGSEWGALESIPFLDRETCRSSLYRAFWVPWVTPRECRFARYVLLRRDGSGNEA